MKYLFLASATFFSFTASSQIDNKGNDIDSSGRWSAHFQLTDIMQGHTAFSAPYSGKNSLNDTSETAFSVTSTLFFQGKLWKGAAFYFNPEFAGGKGVSGALGIAGFTNGETFRIGNPAPTLYVARAFLRQHFKFGSDETEMVEEDLIQVREIRPVSRITVTAGKFSIADVYDNNSYSHDPRKSFFNWALMSNGAWDYPANTRGYTSGIIVELIKPGWAVRISETLMPVKANGSVMDYNISKARGETIEFEKEFKIKNHPGAIRLLGFRNLSHARNYREAINSFKNGIDTTLNVNVRTEYGGKKYGLAVNVEQELTENIGTFARASWNDGHTATWVFTEIDESISGGINIKGTKWKRPDDVIGIAGIVNNISLDHWDFINTGGYGFMIGDGKLPHYGSEAIGEIFYSMEITKTLWLTADYQYVQNPAYNRDRGPVHVWAVRAHVEF